MIQGTTGMSFPRSGRWASVLLMGLVAVLVHEALAQPNVVLIMTDDQGHGDFGCTGNPILRTPHLDALAEGSARMTQFYVSPVCAPTRASLLTGRYNYRTRVRDTYIGRAMMDPEEQTIAEILREHGYATGLFGKWHLGDNYPLRPMDQGFEESLVHRGGGIGQPSDPPGGEGKYTDPILSHNGALKQYQGYCTDLYFDHALQFIRRATDRRQPFFAYIATNAPHGPYDDRPADLADYYDQFDYARIFKGPNIDTRLASRERDHTVSIFAMIENIDQNVGRLFDGLRGWGILDDTLVIFLHDNGPNGDRYASGFRGFKGQVWEGGVRSVFWAHWPARLTPGRESDRIAAHIDVMPTILDACRVPLPTDRTMDGRSLLPLLTGEPRAWPDRTLFLQWHRGDVPQRYRHFCARTQQWKLLNSQGVGEAWQEAPRQFELYHLPSDPAEQENLAAERPEVVERLKAEYDAWFDSVSTTRSDNWASPAIHLGTPHENPTTLTRQDWQHTLGDPWGRQSLGYWLVHVVSAGTYDFHLRFPGPAPDGGQAVVTVGDRAWRIDVPSGATCCEIRGAELEVGPTRLEARLLQGNVQYGAHQLDVTWNES